MEHDLLCIGDCTIDAFLAIQSPNDHCHLNEKDNELCIKLGHKIPVDRCDFSLGGNACNIAVGTSRLGLRVMLMAEIGSDEFAQKILRGLSEENIDTSHMLQTQGSQTSFAVGINVSGERTLFVEHVRRDHVFSFDGIATKWVYLTSIGQVWEKVYESARAFVQTVNAKLAFSPGSYQLKQQSPLVRDTLARTDVLCVNKEEAETLIKQYAADSVSPQDIKTVLSVLHALGPKVIVLTNGREGSYLFSEEAAIHVGTLEIPVVERTGAGDAHTGGFLAALIIGHTKEDAMRWGTRNAASVIGKIGAQKGLMTRYEIEKEDELLKTLAVRPL